MQKRAIPILVLLAFLAGCLQQTPPLFDPQAQPLNRIASGMEINTELAGLTKTAVAEGLLSKQQAKEFVVPYLKQAETLLGEAKVLFLTGDQSGYEGKLNLAQSVIKTLQRQLAAYQKEKSQ